MSLDAFDRISQALLKMGWIAPVKGVPNEMAADLIARCLEHILEHGYDPK